MERTPLVAGEGPSYWREVEPVFLDFVGNFRGSIWPTAEARQEFELAGRWMGLSFKLSRTARGEVVALVCSPGLTVVADEVIPLIQAAPGVALCRRSQWTDTLEVSC